MMRSLVFGLLLSAAVVAQPNVLFILVDDLGINDLGCEGSTFHETPNIDALAAKSVRFAHGYSTSRVCSPSRASLMTGQYPARIGITDWIGAKTGKDWPLNDALLPAEYIRSLPHDVVTMPEAFAAGGYRTFFAGKWHLGDEGSGPLEHGFQRNVGGYWSGGPRGGFYAPYDNPALPDGPAGESLTLRLAQETADFINEEDEAPFFAFLSFYTVHSPVETTQELWAKYREKSAAIGHEGERFLIDRTLPVRQVQDHPIYAGMVETLDDAVGLVLQALAKSGKAENTVVVFTSDNGGVSSGDAYSTSCLPLRGGKGRQWEGGIRQPYYIAAPGIGEAGRVSEVFATGSDFYPTLLELAGLPPQPDQHLDGVSLVPSLRGEAMGERMLFWHYPHYGNQGGEPSSIVRSGDWKLIYYHEDGRSELYRLDQDIGEQRDLASEEPRKVAEMKAALVAHLEEVEAKYPLKNPDYDPDKPRDVGKLKAYLEKSHAGFVAPDFDPGNDWWGSAKAQ